MFLAYLSHFRYIWQSPKILVGRRSYPAPLHNQLGKYSKKSVRTVQVNVEELTALCKAFGSLTYDCYCIAEFICVNSGLILSSANLKFIPSSVNFMLTLDPIPSI